MSLDESISTPTADAGTDSQDTGTAPAAPAAQPERTYTQADMDRAAAWYRKSLREERDRIEQQYRQPEPPAQPGSDPVASDLRSLKQQMTEFQLDRAISDLSKRYPEFGNEQQLAEVLGIVVDRGLDRVTHLPIGDVLDLAYRYWKADHSAAQPPMDVEAIKRQAKDEAVKEYLANKATTSASTPKPEGLGGATPVAPAKPKDWKSADSVAMEIIRKSRAT